MATSDDPAAIGQAPFKHDQAALSLGICISCTAPGQATASMTVRSDMLQGHQTCHGGLIFTLAGTAFAYACNNRNQAAVAAGCSIEFLKPAMLGDILQATATELVLAGRTGIYDVLVSNQHGQTVAVFRGRSAAIKGQALPH
jgi:acyl-CoA thioesterase